MEGIHPFKLPVISSTFAGAVNYWVKHIHKNSLALPAQPQWGSRGEEHQHITEAS